MRRIWASIILVLGTAAVILAATFCLNTCAETKGLIMNEETKAVPTPGAKDVDITVVYDNNPYKEGLETGWGFSCVITGVEKTILFDTGGDGSILLRNMEKLVVDPNRIDVVVLSHIHGDHTGGLRGFLGKNADVTVYLPESFPETFKGNVEESGAKIVEVQEPLAICENVYSSGQLGRRIKEQSLVVRTDKGVVVVTGCAHPGIVKMVSAAKDLLKDKILLVMGGFHLEWATKGKIRKITSAFKELGVRNVGPCHCSGGKCRGLFEKHFGKNYIDVGAGKTVAVGQLE